MIATDIKLTKHLRVQATFADKCLCLFLSPSIPLIVQSACLLIRRN